jgi:hypothetical protein
MAVAIHPDVLSNKLNSVLRRVGAVVNPWGFYLGGGTALALWLGHRRSVDLDWFDEERISDPFLGHLLYSLCYFADADAERMPTLLRPVKWRQIKATIREFVRAGMTPE